MKAVTIVDGSLRWAEHPDPAPGPGQLLVSVAAAGLNAADLLQRAGFYPAPPDVPPDIPGLEAAGVVRACGPGVTRFSVGDRVMALLGGGAQAELAVADERHTLAVPDSLAWEEAGALPEVFATAHDALFTQCALAPGERVLVTGAAGGVGTAAVQLAAAAGCSVVASVRKAELRGRLLELGASRAEDPGEALGHGPFDVVLELVGGEGFPAALGALATGGRVAVIGVGAGTRVEIDLLELMRRRATVHGSTLRARDAADKELVMRRVEHEVLPLVAAGRVRVPVALAVAMAEAEVAYERFATGGKLGKVVIVSS